ncbi:putative orfan [Tupanvirus soda lake]|uniref:Orfan n=2 Tax=Tupanvirus TaxID=2094720 RepID=A0AC62AD42_9VIRU|nr:putative orfan [Tupanvirus soda lake]QKU35710.1 putative orfan [Tupanvirus soda lake]
MSRKNFFKNERLCSCNDCNKYDSDHDDGCDKTKVINCKPKVIVHRPKIIKNQPTIIKYKPEIIERHPKIIKWYKPKYRCDKSDTKVIGCKPKVTCDCDYSDNEYDHDYGYGYDIYNKIFN